MGESRFDRWVPLSGIAFFLLLVASFALRPSGPDPGEPAGVIAEFFDDDGDQLVTTGYLAMLSTFFLVWFSAALRAALRRSEGQGELAAAAVFGGGVATAVCTIVATFPSFAAASLSEGELDPQTAKTLLVLDWNSVVLIAIPLAVMLAGAGLGVLRTRVLPAWLGWVAAVFALVLLTPLAFFAFVLSPVWVLAASIAMLLRARREPTAAAR